MEEEGVAVGEMNKLLLQKVEELTLWVNDIIERICHADEAPMGVSTKRLVVAR